MKKCSKCGKEKSLDEYENSKGGRFGKRADCRKCRNAARVARRLADPESRNKDRAAGRRAASKLAKDPERVAERNRRGREHYADDPTRYSETRKAWNAANSDKILEYRKKYRDSGKQHKANKAYKERNREHLNACARVRNANNPEPARAATKAWRLANLEHVKRYSAQYREDNRLYFASKQSQRRATIKGLRGSATAEQVKERFDFHGNKCIYCGCCGPMEIEHMIPISRGGTNWPANLAPACRSCNSSKRSKTFFEFKGEQ